MVSTIALPQCIQFSNNKYVSEFHKIPTIYSTYRIIFLSAEMNGEVQLLSMNYKYTKKYRVDADECKIEIYFKQ